MAIRLERIDADRFDATNAYVRRHVDHGYSFTDCSSVVLMRELRIREAVTTDAHFVEAAFDARLGAS